MNQKARQLIEEMVRAKPGVSVGEVATHLYRSLDHEQASYTWMINEAVAEGLIQRGEGEEEERLFPAGHEQSKP